MTDKRKPLPKRYPGQHVVRCRIWFPSGTWVEYEGPLSASAAETISSAIVNDAPMLKGEKKDS